MTATIGKFEEGFWGLTTGDDRYVNPLPGYEIAGVLALRERLSWRSSLRVWRVTLAAEINVPMIEWGIMERDGAKYAVPKPRIWRTRTLELPATGVFAERRPAKATFRVLLQEKDIFVSDEDMSEPVFVQYEHEDD